MVEAPAPAGAEEHALAALAPRALLPQIASGVVAPFLAYQLARRAGLSDAAALATSSAPPALAVLVEWLWRRRLNLIGAAVLLGIGGGLLGLVLFHGNELLLKLRDVGATATLGLACLGTLVLPVRPAMFYVGRLLAGMTDRARMAEFDMLWERPEARRTFSVLTLVWGIGLLGEAALRVVLALELPTGVFLAVAPLGTGVVIGGLLAFTVVSSRRARRRAGPPAPAAEHASA